MSKKLLYTFVLSLIACCIEVDISVPSLPDISDYFDISDGLTQMTIAVNFLGFCISAAFYGPLSEVYGRRRIMIAGNALMFIGAFGCMIATSIEFLLISRFIQGLGASASVVIVFAMVADLCKGPETAEVISKMNSLLTIFMSIAPVAGGVINEAIGWRGNYGTVFLVSFIAWIMLYFILPETKSKLEPLDFKKIFKDYFRLLSSYNFMLMSLVPSLMFAGYMSFIACGSFLYMETFNLPIMYYALHQGAIIACFSIISQKADRIYARFGEYNTIFYGVLMLVVGGLSLFTLGYSGINNPFLTTGSMIIGATGAAISYPLVFAKSFEVFPDIKGTASSAIMSIRMLVTAGFVATVSSIYDGSLLKVALIVAVGNMLTALLSISLLKRIDK